MRVRGSFSGLVLRGAALLIYLFMLGPIVITAAASFNETDRSYFPPHGLSLRWWRAAFTPQWMGAVTLCLELATISALATAATGLPLAIALHRYQFPGKRAVEAMAMGPLVLPSLVTGIALLQFLTLAGLGTWIGLPALVIGHIVICMPFALRTILVSLKTIPTNAEQAASSLGAGSLAVLREVTLPLARAGIGAGMIFAFISSFDDVNLSLFVASPQERPLTVQIMSFLEYGFSPTLAAVSVLSMLLPLVLVAVFGRFVGLSNFLQQERGHG